MKKEKPTPQSTASVCPNCGEPVKPGQSYCKKCYFTLPGCEEYESEKTKKAAKKSKLGFVLFKRKPKEIEPDVPNFGTEDWRDAVINNCVVSEKEMCLAVEKEVVSPKAEELSTPLTTEVIKDIAERAGVDVEPLAKTNIGMSFKQKMIILDDKSNLEISEMEKTKEESKKLEVETSDEERKQLNANLEKLNEQIISGGDESSATRNRLRDAEEILRGARAKLDARKSASDNTGTFQGELKTAGNDTESFLRELEAEERVSEEERKNKRLQLEKELEEEHGKIVSSLESELEKVRQIALYDELTGLKNRHAFDEDAKNFDLKNLTILSIDVNNLKPTNDNYGHAYGDRLLTSVAEALSEIYGSECYRTGGDEFIVVLDGIRNKVLEKRKTDLDEILKRKEAAFDVDIPISIAYGVGIGNGVKTLKEIMDEADAQMYRDKESIKALQRQIAKDMEEVYVPVSELNITTSESSVPNFGTKIEKKELPHGADFLLSEVIEHKQAPRNTEKKDDDFYINSEFHRQLHFFILYVVKNLAVSSIMIAILIWLKNVNI